MKCFERLVKTHICSFLPAILDPQQIDNRTNKSTDYAIALAKHTAVTHLDKGNTNVRKVFIDNSSEYNTTIPSKLVTKFADFRLASFICSWIFDFLTGRPQVVRIAATPYPH